jgi:anti-sigma B factor antagonist
MKDPIYDEATNSASLALAGDLNMETAERLKVVFKEIMEKGVITINLDFRDVEIIKSVCIGLLVSVYKSVSAKGGSIRIVNTSPNVRKIFEITRLAGLLNVS